MRRLPLSLRLIARRGPKAPYEVRRETAVPVPAADGSPLLTDHYAPVTSEPCPAVLIRAPYVRSGFPWNLFYGVRFAEQGFHVLMQSSRGTGGSGGVFHTWNNEVADSRAAVEWLRKQSWFTGDLFTVGASYMAYTQAALAVDAPPEWRGAVMQVGHTDPYDFFWGSGAFTLERALVGGLGLVQGEVTSWDMLCGALRLKFRMRRATEGLPLLDAYPSAIGGRRPALEEWLTHPEPGHWAETDLVRVAGAMDVPTSLLTGWWDLSPGQVIEQYTRMRAAGRDVDLLIGPWTHTNFLERDWPEVFAQAMRRLRREPPAYRVRVHVGGVNEWRDLPDWPPPDAHPTTLPFDQLRAERGWKFLYDPADPTPSIGGALQSPTQGQVDNAPLESRKDVLLFTGEPLEESLTLMGPVRAELDASTTAASGDLFVRLCDVDPEGVSRNICDGLTRITADARHVVDLGHAAHVFRPGHRVRVQVSGGAHPRFLRNYGTGEPPSWATALTPTETTIRPGSVLELSMV
ncbi:CocE/NonD family hydrolase [Paractinoplanes lichenicola]|uniref:CocE/NonD family hydrolase n=1 Tax=Paractinoplanes lichenicola TaxID=2802976 RepID=A0ABS1VHL4_9ACTN|nr:CocE/NonD family hydrolase [Actinoplanes lichenicola]MBL7254135.1 CocE/NonD family hydrolase [Actinoplanes lichenicola]